MIEVTYHRSKYCLTASGHAHSGESGHDLVCAAVSALVLTLAANVGSLVTSANADDHMIYVQEGNAQIRCRPAEKMENVVKLIFDTVCTGFDMLQGLYPENISYRVLG